MKKESLKKLNPFRSVKTICRPNGKTVVTTENNVIISVRNLNY